MNALWKPIKVAAVHTNIEKAEQFSVRCYDALSMWFHFLQNTLYIGGGLAWPNGVGRIYKVSIRMSDHLNTETTLVCNQPPRPTQPTTHSETGNEQRPKKCGDALRLAVKAGMAHSTSGCMCGWQDVIHMCDPSLTCALSECFVVSQTQ